MILGNEKAGIQPRKGKYVGRGSGRDRKIVFVELELPGKIGFPLVDLIVQFAYQSRVGL